MCFLCGHIKAVGLRGARMRGKTDGSVIATLKQGHTVSAADTAILRGCIIAYWCRVRIYHPLRTERGHAIFIRFTPKAGTLDLLDTVYVF